MIKYCYRKFCEYYFHKISEKDLQKVSDILSFKEFDIFNNMDSYDKYHSINVYKKLENKDIPAIYLKLALLHDCGKENISFCKRVIHKLGFKTILREHPKLGYNKVKDINLELAVLISKHHDKIDDEYMCLFQDADDRS
ncbi:HD domain-containing protein [Caviibacter abscessus]|uniref:HD domain-containing protein n=1 Tax=Caviibacter abscessus TaxID=1766719 RepID=UPI0008373BEF|nr:HD domain-containing protein [Caviibacter abscessus]